MVFGNVIKRTNSDFVVFVDLNAYGSGYNVVPKSVDPYNAYDIDEVRQYCMDNPGKVFDDYNPQPQPEPQPKTPTWQDKMESQIIYTAMMTNSLIEEE